MGGPLGKGDADVLDLAGLAGDLDGHGGAADFAILDGGVIALGGVGGGGDDFTAMRALNLDLDEHGWILTELTELTTENAISLGNSIAPNVGMRGFRSFDLGR
jgi:hypothetical protein